MSSLGIRVLGYEIEESISFFSFFADISTHFFVLLKLQYFSISGVEIVKTVNHLLRYLPKTRWVVLMPSISRNAGQISWLCRSKSEEKCTYSVRKRSLILLFWSRFGDKLLQLQSPPIEHHDVLGYTVAKIVLPEGAIRLDDEVPASYSAICKICTALPLVQGQHSLHSDWIVRKSIINETVLNLSK